MFTADDLKAYFKEEELSDRRLRIIEIRDDMSLFLGKTNFEGISLSCFYMLAKICDLYFVVKIKLRRMVPQIVVF